MCISKLISERTRQTDTEMSHAINYHVNKQLYDSFNYLDYLYKTQNLDKNTYV